MTTISIKLPDALAAQLDEAARAQQKSRSAFFREALRRKLASARKHRKPSLHALTKDLCGVGDSGLGDLSSNPKYLAEFGS